MPSDFIWHVGWKTIFVECKETQTPLALSKVSQMETLKRMERIPGCSAVLVIDFHGKRRHDFVMVRPSDMHNWCLEHNRKSLNYDGAIEIGVGITRNGTIAEGTLALEAALFELRRKGEHEMP